MSSLNKILDDTTRKYADAVNCDRPIHDYLQRQINGIYEMESDYRRGLAILQEGVEMESETLEELWKKSFTTAK